MTPPKSATGPMDDATLGVPVAAGAPVWLALVCAPPDVVAFRHMTWSGTATPAPVQMFFANLTATSWSAWGQAEARQQAIPSRKAELEQIHMMSRLLQPAMAVPEVYLFTQSCCATRRKSAHRRYGCSPGANIATSRGRATMGTYRTRRELRFLRAGNSGKSSRDDDGEPHVVWWRWGDLWCGAW